MHERDSLVDDFVFSPTWWFGLLLFGGMTIVSVLEWRGVIRTPFEKPYPATAMGTGIACATWTALTLAFRRKPPRWAVPRHFRQEIARDNAD